MALFTKLCMDALLYMFYYSKATKIDTNTDEKIMNHLMNKNILPLIKVSSLRQDG